MILLDTHVLVWSLLSPDNLSATARDVLSNARNRCVSAASLYEITLKGQLGKWPEVEHLIEKDLDQDLKDLGFVIAPSNGAIMQMAGAFDWVHRDPFDRIIVATALVENMPVVSKDKTLDTCPSPELQRRW